MRIFIGLMILFIVAYIGLWIFGFFSDRLINNPDALPALNQHQDFTSEYNYVPTDVRDPDGTRPSYIYSTLNNDHAVGHPVSNGQVDEDAVRWGFATLNGVQQLDDPPGRPDPFRGTPDIDSTDYDNIVGGGYHCSPVSAAMALAYMASEHRQQGWLLGAAAGPNLHRELIEALAQEMDTNDQNTALNNGSELGHFGTAGRDLLAVLRTLPDADVRATGFDFIKYRHAIDANLPVLLSFQNPDIVIGHTVVGYGYNEIGGDEIVYSDPDTGARARKYVDDIHSDSTQKWMKVSYAHSTEPSKANGQWVNTVQIVVELRVSP